MLIISMSSCNSCSNRGNTNEGSVECSSEINDYIPHSISLSENQVNHFSDKGEYRIDYQNNNIIIVVSRSGYFDQCYEPGMKCLFTEIISAIMDIYKHFNSRFSNSGTYHIYISFYAGDNDSYGNKLYPAASYVTSIDGSEVKKYKSASYFNDRYNLVRQMVHVGYPEMRMEDISTWIH